MTGLQPLPICTESPLTTRRLLALFSKLKARFANYSLLGAADTSGRIFCTSLPTSYSSVASQPFFERAMAQPGLAVGNYWVDPSDGQRMIHFAERFELMHPK